MAKRISKRRLKIIRKRKERALVSVLQEEITREIDKEILKELVKMSYKYS